ncbi:MAG TPA: homocysteine S-methyltransferase family protein [Thermoleophilia bacterium]|nr:homocysteine S-methyltransferase family protein [Thermoleophilia bacterium]
MDLFALIDARPLLLDGGLGRALMERGFAAGECPEEWNVSHPAEVEDIHRSFYAAGADVVNTNTFGGTAMRLEAHGLSARAVELNEAGARLAVGVRDREFPGRWVAGDVGPCGQMVKPMGNAEPDALRATFAEQARALIAGGVDLLNIETMFDLTEATVAVEAAVAAAAGRPVLASMAFKPAAKGFRTMMGVSPEAAVRALKDAGADLVGCNCEITAEPMAELVRIMADLGGGVTYAQPNAGQPRLEAGETIYGETPEHFAAVVATYPALGAGIVGGCCGTPPASIAALAAALGR